MSIICNSEFVQATAEIIPTKQSSASTETEDYSPTSWTVHEGIYQLWKQKTVP